jgi:hypothetical protein
MVIEQIGDTAMTTMVNRVKANAPQYSTAQLLEMALHMLDVAREEQSGRKPVNKQWLTDNLTLEVIRDHVANFSK